MGHPYPGEVCAALSICPPTTLGIQLRGHPPGDVSKEEGGTYSKQELIWFSIHRETLFKKSQLWNSVI